MNRQQALSALTAPGARFEIIEELVDGRPTRVFKDRLRHLSTIAEIAHARGNLRTFLIAGERRYTFGRFVETANSVGHELTARFGVLPGDRVAILAENSLEWCLAAWAVLRVSGVVVACDTAWPPGELSSHLHDAGASIVITDRLRWDARADAICDCPTLRAVLVTDAMPVEAIAGRNEDLLMAPFAALTRHPTDRFPIAPLREDDPAIVLYSRVRYGRSQGVVMTHRQVIAGIQAAALLAATDALMTPADAPPAPGQSTERQLGGPLSDPDVCRDVLIAGLLTGMTVTLVEPTVSAGRGSG